MVHGQNPLTTALVLISIAMAPMSVMADDVYWNDAAGGNFSDDTNWDTGAAPGPGDNAFITLDGTYTVVLDANTEVQTLTLGAATGTQTLSLSSRTLTLTGAGSVGSNGIILLRGSTISHTATLTNDGRIEANGSAHLSGTGVLSNESSGTIRIEGENSWAHAGLTIANGFSNLGTIEVSSVGAAWSSRLTVSSGTLVNTNLIDVQAGSGGARYLYAAIDNQDTIDLGSATTINPPGSATAANSGDININSGNATFQLSSDTFSNTGTIDISGGDLSILSGNSFTNTGTLSIDSGRQLSFSNITFNQDAGTLDGPGTLSLSNTTTVFNTDFSNAVTTLLVASSTLNGTGTLTNANSLELAGSTINTPFTNSGVLTTIGSCHINSGAGLFTTGAASTIRIEAENSWTHAGLTIANGFSNLGTIEMSSVGAAWSSTLTVNSGTLVNTNLIDVQAGDGGARTIYAAIDNQDTIDLGSATTINPPGSATTSNSGDININSGNTTFQLSSDTFSNSGTITIISGAELFLSNGDFTNFDTGSLTGGTYDVAGTFKFTGAAITTIAAEIILDGSSATIVNQSGTDAMPGLADISSGGSFEITNGHGLSLTATLASAGDLTVGDGSTLTVNGDLTQTAGRTTLDNGTIEVSTTFDLTTGELTGSGTVDGDLVSAGTVAPGASPGLISVTGSHSQSAAHLLEIELAGADVAAYDRLVSTGATTIDGELTVSLLGGFAPPPGTTYDIVSGSSVTPVFATTNIPLVYPGGCLDILYPGDRVRLDALAAVVITTPPQSQTICPGDPAMFSVAATGGGTLGYQWRKNGIDIPLANLSTFTIAAVGSGDEAFYDVVVTNLCGAVPSAAAELSLGEAPIVTTDPVNQIAYEGQPVKFTVAVSGNPTPDYQWRKDGTEIPGEDGASLVLHDVSPTDDGDYDVVVTNDCGSETSAAATLEVVDPPLASIGRSFCSEPDDGLGRPELPPELCEYLSPSSGDIFVITDGLPAGATIEAVPVLSEFVCLASPCGSPGGTLGGEIELFDATLRLHMTGTGALAGFSRIVTIPVAVETHSGPHPPGDEFKPFAVELYTLEGAVSGDPDFDDLEVRAGTGLGLSSPGTASVFQRSGSAFGIEEVFNLTYEIDFIGAAGSVLDGLADTTSGSAKLAVDNPPGILDPCIVTDAGGTAELPPEGCIYHSASEPIIITDGLPTGATVLLTPVLRDFVCQNTPCGQPGGSLGGEVELYDSVLELAVRGTGPLAGFERTLVLSASNETHSAPRIPGDPVQHFLTATESLDASLSGDPDFDSLTLSMGAANGFPSPGLATLTDRQDGSFAVDSFFDLSYEVDFSGAPGGALNGFSGANAGRVGLTATVPGLFADGFESGDHGGWISATP